MVAGLPLAWEPISQGNGLDARLVRKTASGIPPQEREVTQVAFDRPQCGWEIAFLGLWEFSEICGDICPVLIFRFIWLIRPQFFYLIFVAFKFGKVSFLAKFILQVNTNIITFLRAFWNFKFGCRNFRNDLKLSLCKQIGMDVSTLRLETRLKVTEPS